jgi:hypothetical protein
MKVEYWHTYNNGFIFNFGLVAKQGQGICWELLRFVSIQKKPFDQPEIRNSTKYIAPSHMCNGMKQLGVRHEHRVLKRVKFNQIHQDYFLENQLTDI